MSSFKDHGDYVTVWEKWIFRGEKLKEGKKLLGKNFAYFLDLKAYQVSDKEYQVLGLYAYSEDGRCLDSEEQAYNPYKFKPVVPNTLGESLWERAMALTNH